MYQPIKAAYINPFILAMTSTFRTMLGVEVRREQLYMKSGSQPSLEISGIIGLSGKAKGTVVLSMSAYVAMEVTAALLGERTGCVDAQVIDAVGELTNIVAGSAKAQLESLELSVSLPSVICGKNHSISLPTGATPIGVSFDSDWGPLCLEVSLVDAGVIS